MKDADRTWRPLLAGADAAKANGLIDRIADILRGRIDQLDVISASITGGYAALSLFFGYLWASQRREADRDYALKSLGLAAEHLASDRMSPSFFQGFPGTAWAMQRILPLVGEPDWSLDQVDTALLSYLGHPSTSYDYDLIRGLVGIGLYFLDRPSPAANEALTLILEHLERRGEKRDGGITWRTPPQFLGSATRARFPNGCYNLGVAHGVPGVVWLLGRMVEQGVETELSLELYSQAAFWLWSQGMDSPTSRFPAFFGDGVEARSAWCYGDAGIAGSMLASARAAQVPLLETQAISLLTQISSRPSEMARITDSCICHGASGLGHILNRAYQRTGLEPLAIAARSWLMETIQLSFKGTVPMPPTKSVDDPRDVVEIGFLTGISGVGLALIAGTSSVEPTWDRLMLID